MAARLMERDDVAKNTLKHAAHSLHVSKWQNPQFVRSFTFQAESESPARVSHGGIVAGSALQRHFNAQQH